MTAFSDSVTYNVTLMAQPLVEDPSPATLRKRAQRARDRLNKAAAAPAAPVPPPTAADVAVVAREEARKAANGRPARADAPPAPPKFKGPLNTAPDVLDALRAAVRGDATLDTQAARWLLDYLTRPGVVPEANPGERLLLELASTCPHCGGKL